MKESVVDVGAEAKQPDLLNNSCLDEKLVQLESRVTEIEKQLNIIFDLINGPQPQKTVDCSKSKSNSKQEARQPAANHYKTCHRRRRITNKTTKKNYPNLRKLNLIPVVKILKLRSPPPAKVDDDVSVGFSNDLENSDSGNEFINNDYTPTEEKTSVILSSFVGDEVSSSLIKIEEVDEAQYEPNFSANINDMDQEDPINCSENEDEHPPATSPQKSSKHLKQKQRQRELRRLKPKTYLLGQFKCPQCPKISRSAKLLQRHIKTRHKPLVHPYNCPDCPKSFGSKGALSIHIRGAHLDPAGVDPHPFKCCTCGKGFKHASRLTRHQEIHSETRPYKCPYCDSAFHQQQGLQTHKAIHLASSRGKPQCALCGQLFMKKQGLTRHVQRVHEKVRAYPCTLCEKRFKTSTHLKYHLGTHSNPKSKKRGLNRDRDADYDEGVIKIKRMRSGVSKIKQIIEEEPEPGTSTSQEIEKN